MADSMWVLLMFDFPVKTAPQRHDATTYRNRLLDLGFSQIQFSVYLKYLVNSSGFRYLLPRLRQPIPDDGHVRIVKLTDEQWAASYRYFGQATLIPENRPEQLALFMDLSDSNVGKKMNSPLGNEPF